MTDAGNLLGRWACRFCRHDQYTHNLIQGCTSCDCLATPGEAAPRTDAELDAPILAEEQERLNEGRPTPAAINGKDA